MMIEEIKKDFPIFSKSDICYLDSSATSQKPKVVMDAEYSFYESENSNIHRGAYSLSISATEKYDLSRRKVKEFINAKHEEEIIFTKNASESINLVAYSYGLQNLKEDDEILISIMEHHSDLVPWQKVASITKAKLKYMYINEDLEISKEEINEKITDKTKLVCITHVSNVLGVINDVKYVAEIAHKKGAKVLVDASQSVPHFKVDVLDIDADFLVFSSHKMMGPLGVGVLYGKREILNEMEPFLMGGDMIEYVYENKTTYAALPNKFEAGTPNIAGVIGLGTAIDYINKVGYEYIEKIDRELTSYAIEKLKKLDYITLYLPKDLSKHTSVISFNIKGVHPHDTASILDSKGVCVRSGNHCAQPLLRFMKVDSTVRASFYLYNTKEDVDKLIEALEYAYSMFKKYLKNSK